jgi:phosphoribosylaminoimidazole carboxylase PurE protein
MKRQVAIIMGSASDARIMKDAVQILKKFKIKCEVKVVSAHRTPEFMQEYALKAEARGLQVIIAGAGGAAHLPGMVASLTTLPVIGVPIHATRLLGLDSLLSIAQMPKGIPVASMAIDNAHNAGLLAVRILALQSSKLNLALRQYQRRLRVKVRKGQSALKKLL